MAVAIWQQNSFHYSALKAHRVGNNEENAVQNERRVAFKPIKLQLRGEEEKTNCKLFSLVSLTARNGKKRERIRKKTIQL